MSSKHKNHLIKDEATTVTTWCGKISRGGGIGKQIKHFTADDGGEFFATDYASLVDCLRCCAKKGWRA